MKTFLCIILLALITFSCQKEVSPDNILATLPTLTTTSATSITNVTAASGGNITDDGGAAITARGVCWSTSVNPTIALSTKTTDGTGSGAFASNITGLTATTVYYVRAYATNSEGTAYGNEISFTTIGTSIALPTVVTASTSGITMATATSGGDVTNNGNGAITSRGVCWSTTANPTIALSTKTIDGSGMGVFASTITGLLPTTTYHVRAYATNSAGTAYGSDSTFTTIAGVTIPTVSTGGLTTITTIAATGGGTVSADGGATVTARGVCWSTMANPTVALSTKTTDGTGVGTFASAITGLTPSTTYHVRAYATNSAGTAYGADVIFNTTTPADVYATGFQAGTTNYSAKLWTNGVSTTLTAGSPGTDAYGMDVFVDGTDVYVAGYTFFTNGVNSTWTPSLWKNGVRTALMTSLNKTARAMSVYVSGGDVYVVGIINNTTFTQIIRLWKNGVPTDITPGTTEAYALSVFVSGTDVYVAGANRVGAGSSVATYWKNGVATAVSTITGHANSIFVNGSDVYVCGQESTGSFDAAVLYKNGVPTYLTTGSPSSGDAAEVYVSGGDVYVAGLEFISNSPQVSVAKVWKNGVVTNLTNGANSAYGSCVMVKGSDVYVGGYQYISSTYRPCIWVNGVVTLLTNPGDPGGNLFSIYVK